MCACECVCTCVQQYLVYDIQMMTGGRRESLSEEEYVYAATQIYVDIVMIFMDLLSLFGNME